MAKPTWKINKRKRSRATQTERKKLERVKKLQVRDAAKSPFRAGPAPGEKTTRFDINQYGGGPNHIRDVCLIEKRRPQR